MVEHHGTGAVYVLAGELAVFIGDRLPVIERGRRLWREGENGSSKWKKKTQAQHGTTSRSKALRRLKRVQQGWRAGKN